MSEGQEDGFLGKGNLNSTEKKRRIFMNGDCFGDRHIFLKIVLTAQVVQLYVIIRRR